MIRAQRHIKIMLATQPQQTRSERIFKWRAAHTIGNNNLKLGLRTSHTTLHKQELPPHAAHTLHTTHDTPHCALHT